MPNVLMHRFNGTTWEELYPTPGPHDQAISTITGLQLALDAKAEKVYVHSRGQNLLTNGTALLGNNTNFSSFEFDGQHANNSPGSFRYTGAATLFTDEFMPVEATKRYKMSIDAKSLNGVGRYFMMTVCYDVDNQSIQAQHHMYRANTLTTLAQELKNGDTVVYLTNVSNWDNSGTAGTNGHLRSIIIWNYTNSFGYLYPPLTYSRNWTNDAWNPGAINYSNNTITLRVPWAGGTIPAGTPLSNGSSGSSYKYNVMSNTLLTTNWGTYTGIMDGLDLSGTNVISKFSPGTAKIKMGWLMNYQGSGETAWFTNMTVTLDYQRQSEMADKLSIARQINGINFDGSANITIPSTDVKTWAKDGLVESAGGNVNDIIQTGFYQGSSLTNAPTTGWYFYIVSRYRSDSSWISQIAISFGSGNTGNRTYTRSRIGGTWSAWVELYHTGNLPLATFSEVQIGTEETIKSFNPKRVKEATGYRSISQGSSKTLEIGDAYQMLLCTAGTGTTTITIPTHASVAFNADTEITICRYGAGEVEISPASGVTIVSHGGNRKINEQYQVVTLKKVNTNVWLLVGALKS